MRFITTLTGDFIPGFKALVHSLEANSGLAKLPPFTVVMYDDFATPIPGLENCDITYVRREDLGEFQFDRNLTNTPRMILNFHKPLIWRLPYDEVCLYLDSDIICLNPLYRLLDYTEQSVVINQAQIGKKVGYDRGYKTTRPVWNAGVMFFRPSEATFVGIQEHARSYVKQLPHGDQVLVNGYFSDKPVLHFIDVTWNTSIFMADRQPTMFDLKQIKLLHCACDQKPWRDPPKVDWQKPLWRLWHEYLP